MVRRAARCGTPLESPPMAAEPPTDIEAIAGPSILPGLQDIEQVRLVLRGDSVIDWRRLAFRDRAHVDEFLTLVGFDPADRDDQLRMMDIQRRALRYIEGHYAREMSPAVRRPPDVQALCLVASRPGPDQSDACMVLKVMHIVHHAAGRELLYRLPVAINELFYRVETKVFEAIDSLKQQGIRVAEFAASRKTEDSIFTKLLCKADSLAADVHDRLRFRIITESLGDLFGALVHLTRALFPFSYVLPGSSRNDLIDLAATLDVDERLRPLAPLLQQLGGRHRAPVNSFSAAGYRVINFVVDIPIRVDDLIEQVPEHSPRKGRVVFLLVEFQLVDRETHRLNDTGANRHSLYKERQRVQVFNRLTSRG